MSGENEIESPKTFTLISPIQVNGAEVTEVTLREPTAGDQEQLEIDQPKIGSLKALNKIVAKQSKLAPVDVREIGARDISKMHEYLLSFFPQGQKSSES